MSRRVSAPGPLSPATKALLATPTSSSEAALARYSLSEERGAHGQHGAVVFAREGGEHVAIKAQGVHTPHNALTRAYREARILRYLGALQARTDVYPSGETGFVRLRDTFKGARTLPELALMTSVGDDVQQLHCVLERAETTLHAASERGLTVGEYRSALFQVLFALKVAQEAFQFMHNDLHAKARLHVFHVPCAM